LDPRRTVRGRGPRHLLRRLLESAPAGLMETVLIIGMGVTGEAVARHVGADRVIVVEDSPSAASRARAEALDIELIEAPAADQLANLVRQSAMVVPSPGVPAGHPVYELAASTGVEL